MYYYFYRIINKINNKVYYGVHQTEDLEDGYMGSGSVLSEAMQKYGKGAFKKEILKTFSDSKSMFDYEREFITEDLVSDRNVYNIKVGGNGGWDYVLKHKLNWSEKAKKTRRDKMKAHHSEGRYDFLHEGRPHSEGTKKILSEKAKEYYANNEHPKGMTGKSHTKETKEHLSKIMKERSSLKGKKGIDHPSGGTKWYNNGVKHCRSNTHPGEGWVEGRIFKNRRMRSKKW